MELGKLLEFRKDLYFEGAVQADWFYSPERASKVAENFVFHGKKYFGVEDQELGIKKKIDTISLVEQLLGKLNDESSNALSLAIADYGTGKSHLAVTLAQIFSGSQYMSDTYNKIIDNISNIDAEAADKIKQLSQGRNFVIVINGMRDFNLHSELIKATQKSMKLYGLSDDILKKINRAVKTAEIFFERNAVSLLNLFESSAHKRGWVLTGESLLNHIRETLLTDDESFEIVNDVYTEINGQAIRWDEGLSASSILEALVSEYCGMNGMFDHIIILFDEFGRYLEYASGVNATKSGESGLQQIYELTQKTQNVEGYLHVINFIQRDIKAYLQTVDQTKNISRYIGRYDESEKYYVSSNLETVFANLIYRKDKKAFDEYIVKWQNTNETKWENMFSKINKWLMTNGIWKEYRLFRRLIVEGIYPLHPISTYMLTHLSDYLQNRSSLTLISKYVEEYSNIDISKEPVFVMPEKLICGDLYTEMLSAEQEGRQKTQQCIKYDNIIRKFGDKLSEKSLMVLRANLILRILRFRTKDYADAKEALSMCSGLTETEINNELRWLVDEYAVMEFDDHAGVFDFTEESNGAHDFKIIKKRLMANTTINKIVIKDVKIQQLAGVLEKQATNFSNKYNITTSEWVFSQELYPIEEFTKGKAQLYINEWEQATEATEAKGKLIWLYVNKDTNPECIVSAQRYSKEFTGMPIVLMLLNDMDNRMFDCLVEYMVLDSMDNTIRKKYERHFQDDFTRVENNLRDEIEALKKQRQRLEETGVTKVTTRIPIFLTNVFEEIYPCVTPFLFDGFVTNRNNISSKAAGYYCSMLKMLFSNSINETTIHNFVVEMRNRVEALLSTTSATSWKCINEQYHIIPPEEKNISKVYDNIVSIINSKHEIKCADIYEIYCKPPYGMSEEAVTMMIAVVCANLSYCLRINYGTLKNINIWKDEIITNNDRKIDLKAIKASTIVFVDAGAIVGKFVRFFDVIKNNHKISEVINLSNRLEEMTQVDEVPEELQQSYLLAQKYLSSGKKAIKEWEAFIRKVEDELETAYEERSLYNALVSLENLRTIPYMQIFNDNGYEYDSECKEKVKSLDDEIDQFICKYIEFYISNMYCKSIEGINTFRNHNTKIQSKLEMLGYHGFAEKVRLQKEKELNNIEEIKSRQTLREDYRKYIKDSESVRYITYININLLLKKGIELQERFEKYKNSLGKDADEMGAKLYSRVEELNEVKNRIDQDMADIWNDLFEVENYEDIEDLIQRITLILQKGITPNDQSDFEELSNSLKGLLDDINKIKETTNSRELFKDCSQQMIIKYTECEFDFDVLTILEDVISGISKKLDEEEEEWENKYLSLGDKSRVSIHKWKENIRFLPGYLSQDTIEAIKKLDQEADSIISEGKIEDVIFYFDKLSKSEKEKCLNRLYKDIQK